MTNAENQPSSQPSPQGRRVLVAVVTGETGRRIQAWREAHDPLQARRLPPHVTLCYWPPPDGVEALGEQVRHAFAERVVVRLGAVREFGNEEQTFYVEVLATGQLDEARRRLYDGRHVQLPPLREWTWHVTCIRDARDRDAAPLRRAAADLCVDGDWRVDTVTCLELRGDRYEAVATWAV
ncbi:MAG: 2'-5' RNA ligase family protein [Dehalococcoidia bacterium]